MESKVQLNEKERWQKWVQGEEDIVWIEEEVREEMVWETEQEMEGGRILQAESGHHRVTGWAIKHWKNSPTKIHL